MHAQPKTLALRNSTIELKGTTVISVVPSTMVAITDLLHAAEKHETEAKKLRSIIRGLIEAERR